jgi:uncharacterized protein
MAKLKILLIGASGNIGRHILREAIARGHAVMATARNPQRIESQETATALALETSDSARLHELSAQVDILISALSPRGGDAALLADRFGKALIEAARATGKRLVVVGGAGSLSFPDGSPVAETLPHFIRPESMAMRGVRDALQSSDIDWTYFSPAAQIVDGERSGDYQLGTAILLSGSDGQSRISVQDYAKALIDEIEEPHFRRSQMTIAYK